MDGRDFIEEIEELTDLVWTDTKVSPGTLGCFLKAYREEEGVRIYYKMSKIMTVTGGGGTAMYKFAIKNPIYSRKTVAWLYYDEGRKEYEIRIPPERQNIG